MKEKWFEFVVANKKCWANGFTITRLNKVRESVFNDSDIMYDLLFRHNGINETPEQSKERDIENYNHCLNNFVCNILYKMMDDGIIH